MPPDFSKYSPAFCNAPNRPMRCVNCSGWSGGRNGLEMREEEVIQWLKIARDPIEIAANDERGRWKQRRRLLLNSNWKNALVIESFEIVTPNKSRWTIYFFILHFSPLPISFFFEPFPSFDAGFDELKLLAFNSTPYNEGKRKKDGIMGKCRVTVVYWKSFPRIACKFFSVLAPLCADSLTARRETSWTLSRLFCWVFLFLSSSSFKVHIIWLFIIFFPLFLCLKYALLQDCHDSGIIQDFFFFFFWSLWRCSDVTSKAQPLSIQMLHPWRYYQVNYVPAGIWRESEGNLKGIWRESERNPREIERIKAGSKDP